MLTGLVLMPFMNPTDYVLIYSCGGVGDFEINFFSPLMNYIKIHRSMSS